MGWEHGVGLGWVAGLCLYSNLSVCVGLDGAARRRHAKVDRGVRQGDPFSFALFINVLRKSLPEWKRKRYGITIGGPHELNTRLHYLSSADDTTLLNSSVEAIVAEDVGRRQQRTCSCGFEAEC